MVHRNSLQSALRTMGRAHVTCESHYELKINVSFSNHVIARYKETTYQY